MTMSFTKKTSILAVLCGAFLLSVPASVMAGECPADKVVKGFRTSGETMPVGVTDDVISSVDLSAKGPEFKGYLLRMRKLVVQPGGVVPWHMHDQRAANILILEGGITEYRSDCSVDINHVAGDVVAEFGPDLAHWWKNNTDKPAVLISADLLPPTMANAGGM